MKQGKSSSRLVRNSAIAAITACLAASAHAQVNPAKLAVFWDFNDATTPTVALDSEHGIVGQLTDGAALTAEGEGRTGTGTDRAVDFGSDGQRQKVRVRNVEWLNQIARAGDVVSVAFWQKLRATGNSYAFWAVSPTHERAISAHAPWSDRTVYWDTGGATAPITRISVPSNTFGDTFDWTNWNHIVFIKNGATKQIWVNGSLMAEGSDSTVPLLTNVTDFTIGGHPTAAPNATTGAVKGWIDDFAVFGGALDGEQITALAAGASPATLDGDGDNDGMPDWWEEAHALNKTSNADAALDGDNDGATNLQEYMRLTNPTVADTDEDGLKDGVESNTGTFVSATNTGTNPILKDTDNDGLADGLESNSGAFVSAQNPGSNPLLADTDGDGFRDYAEAALGGNPVSATVGPMKPSNVNLFAWWDFDDATVGDQSLDKIHSFKGHLLNGAVYTEPGLGRSGQGTDRALDLGMDVGELMNIENPRWLGALSVSNAATITFWEKWHDVVTANSAFYFDDDKVWNVPIMQAHVPWTDRGVYWDTTVSAAPVGRINKALPTEFDVTAWHHYAFVKNGDLKRIFIDGVLFHEGNNTGVLPPDVARAFVGGHIGTPAPKSSVNGLIDDFAVFGKALDATEIAALAGGATPSSLAGDADGDGMPDVWEEGNQFNKNLASDAAQDADSDGLTNLQEYLKGTLPRNDDSDADGLKDGAETGTGTWVSATNTGTNPLNADSDSDGLRDGIETNTGVFGSATNTGTNPLNTDSDADQFSDSTEVVLGSNPALGSSTPVSATGINLLAYWNFNTTTEPQTALDVVHGIPANMLGEVGYSGDTEGRSAAAGDFAANMIGGQGNVIRVANAQWLGATAPRNELTISMWQRHANNPPGASASFWADASNPTANRWIVGHVPWSDNNIYFDTGGGSTAGTHRINKSVNDLNPEFDWTVWHHFAFVKKGTLQQIYIDGVLFHEGNVTAAIQNDAVQLGIGGQPTGGNAMTGMIDDFAVFATALDAAQIDALAKGALPTAINNVSLSITAMSYATGVFSFSWGSEAGQTFKVFRATNVAGPWNPVADVNANANGSTTSYTDNAPPAGANAVFYRVQRQ